jgi:hypothetical protein
MYKIWISTSAMTPWRASLNFRADGVVFFFLCDLLCLLVGFAHGKRLKFNF